ncbi:MAG: hypothetical protein ACE5JL_18860 [Dehalococcoidia bacterium]
MTPEQARTFVADQGVVLESARGPVPSLVEAILQLGSWIEPMLGRAETSSLGRRGYKSLK